MRPKLLWDHSPIAISLIAGMHTFSLAWYCLLFIWSYVNTKFTVIETTLVGLDSKSCHDLSYKLPVAAVTLYSKWNYKPTSQDLVNLWTWALFIDFKAIGPIGEPVIYFPLFLGAVQGVHSTWEKVWWQRRDRRCDSQQEEVPVWGGMCNRPVARLTLTQHKFAPLSSTCLKIVVVTDLKILFLFLKIV